MSTSMPHTTAGTNKSPEGQVSRPSPARVYNYYLDGKDHYGADRRLAEAVLKVAPFLPRAVLLNRRFVQDSTALATSQGVRQFLDLGCGLPHSPYLHEAAATLQNDVRAVYVDHDPHVIAHARALMDSGPPVTVAHLQGDLLEMAAVLVSSEVTETFDLDQPVCVSLHAVLHLIPDDGAVHALIDTLTDWMPPGSYLSLTHPTADYQPHSFARIAQLYAGAGLALRPRTRQEVTALFDGLRLLHPGVTATGKWLRDFRAARLPPDASAAYAGIAVKS